MRLIALYIIAEYFTSVGVTLVKKLIIRQSTFKIQASPFFALNTDIRITIPATIIKIGIS